VLGNQKRVPSLLALSIYPNWNVVVAPVDVQTVDVAVATLAMAAVRDEVQTNLILVSFLRPTLFVRVVNFLMLFYWNFCFFIGYMAITILYLHLTVIIACEVQDCIYQFIHCHHRSGSVSSLDSREQSAHNGHYLQVVLSSCRMPAYFATSRRQLRH